MKHILIVLTIVFSCVQGYSQSEKVKEKINQSKDRLVFELNSGVLLHDSENGFDTKGFQRGFNLYFMYDIVIKDSPVSFAPGIGISTENWYHNSQIVFSDSFTTFTPFADSISYKKSKLALAYIDIPLEIRFRTKANEKNGWRGKVAVGFKFGFLVGSKWRYKGNEFRDPAIRADTDGTIKFREQGIPNMERFRYGPTLRGGYGPFNLHFYYSLSELFSDGKGPRMQPLVFGISINGL